jgi:L-ascorbate metabolism protein UlaG (beta-lactamase superfamily)
MTELATLLQGVTRGTQSTLLVTNGKVLWVDSFQVDHGDPKADVLLITHAHADHCSPGDVQKVMKPGTVVVGPPDCISKVPVDEANKIAVMPGDRRTLDGFSIDVVPAYNIDKPFHPKANNWVGYIVSVGGRRIYHAGDTDRIPEMKTFETDVAFLPIGGTYTMNAQEAAAAASEDIKPKIAVPMHYGAVVGSDADAQSFSELCTTSVAILTPSL